MEKNPLLYIAVAVALVLGGFGALGALSGHGLPVSTSSTYGSTGEPSTVSFNPVWFPTGISIGQTGTYNQNTQFGTCNLIGGSAGIGATTTANFDCAVTGVKAGDTIFGDPSAGELPGVLYDFPVVKAVASTTNGFVTFTVLNLSGAASTTLGVPVTNGVEYLTYR